MDLELRELGHCLLLGSETSFLKFAVPDFPGVVVVVSAAGSGALRAE